MWGKFLAMICNGCGWERSDFFFVFCIKTPQVYMSKQKAGSSTNLIIVDRYDFSVREIAFLGSRDGRF